MGAVSYLLDTHALLWWLFKDRRMSRRASAVVRDPGNQILVSRASAWEIATKRRLGRLDDAAPLIADFGGWMVEARFHELPIRSEHRRAPAPGTSRTAIRSTEFWPRSLWSRECGW